MSVAFDALRGLIVVRAKVFGPARNLNLFLALDTGASVTLINQSRLLRAGYDPSTAQTHHQMTTASGTEFAPRLELIKLFVLGQSRANFPVLCHNLPPSASIDGLLGLDFFRGLNLNLDFRTGRIALT